MESRTYRDDLPVPVEQLRRIRKYLTEEPATESDCLGENETISYICPFPNGYEIDIKCCGVQYQEGESNLAWTEAVLFLNGIPVNYTDPCEEFEGEWELSYGSSTFIVNVIPK